jgi:Zn-dependent peptidase ImmA (M78 family)
MALPPWRRKEAVSKAIRELLARAGATSTPVDLRRVAEAQGVTHIEETDLGTLDGCLIPTTDGFVIKINSRMPDRRRRFSLAHEIAHTLLRSAPAGCKHRTLATSTTVSRPRSRHREERLCDMLAAEILMPEIPFQRWISHAEASIRAIEATATHFEVSLQAAAIRFGEMVDAMVEIICWKRQRTTLAPEWFSGSPQFRYHSTEGEMCRPLFCLDSGPVRALWSGTLEINNNEPPCPTTNGPTFYCESKAFGTGHRRYVLSVVKQHLSPLELQGQLIRTRSLSMGKHRGERSAP